jgi:hypothetical protein
VTIGISSAASRRWQLSRRRRVYYVIGLGREIAAIKLAMDTMPDLRGNDYGAAHLFEMGFAHQT